MQLVFRRMLSASSSLNSIIPQASRPQSPPPPVLTGSLVFMEQPGPDRSLESHSEANVYENGPPPLVSEQTRLNVWKIGQCISFICCSIVGSSFVAFSAVLGASVALDLKDIPPKTTEHTFGPIIASSSGLIMNMLFLCSILKATDSSLFKEICKKVIHENYPNCTKKNPQKFLLSAGAYGCCMTLMLYMACALDAKLFGIEPDDPQRMNSNDAAFSATVGGTIATMISMSILVGIDGILRVFKPPTTRQDARNEQPTR